MANKRKSAAAVKEIAFDYIKSNFFRVVSVDGAFGGLSPSGKEINMAIFSERRPIPKKTVHALNPDGVLGAENKERREGRTAIIREIEVDLVLDLETAIRVHEWLQRKIEEFAKATGVSLQITKDEAVPQAVVQRKARGKRNG